MRKWLIGISVFVHFALILGLFITGMWRLDRLDAGRSSVNLQQPLVLREAAAAAGSQRKTPEFTHKTLPKETVQPPAHVETKPEVASPEIGTTEGSGQEGSGSGSGSNTDDPPGQCVGDDCGQGSAQVVVEKKPIVVVKPKVIAPVKLRELRLPGETQIQPPDVVKTEIMRAGGGKVSGSFMVCLDSTGRVSSTSITKSTGYPGYDAELSRAMRDWRYRPYTVDGVGIPVCGMVSFIYSMK